MDMDNIMGLNSFLRRTEKGKRVLTVLQYIFLLDVFQNS